jgi:hypothetical protein
MADEDHKDRVDRELIELLNEVRVALPGVQVLFAFLLILPFQQGFADISDMARWVYFAGLLASAVASGFLIAPATYHRLTLRRGVREKEQMLFTSSRFVLIGTGFIAAGIACSLFVVTSVLFGELAAIVAAVLAALFFAALWFVFPIVRRGPKGAEDER